MQTSTQNLSASTDISTLSLDSEIGKVLSLRWKRIETASAKSIIDFDKPLGDLLCKLRAALDADQKQIPSKTLNVNNLNKIDRRRRSEAERLARDWNVVVSHLGEAKTVGEIAESKQFSSTTALLAAVDKPKREAKAAEKKAEKEAAKAEAETEEAAIAEEAAKPMTADEIVFEAMLLCSVNRVSDADFIAAVKRQITMLSEAA